MKTFRNIYKRPIASYTEFHAHSVLKIKVAALIGIITLPAYHFIWQWLSVPVYQNMPLRLAGVGLCLGVLSITFWPASFAKFQLPLTYIATTFCLPFFFSFMTLMNGGSHIWQLSSIAAVVYLVFLFDAVNILISTTIGVSLSFIGFIYFGAETNWPSSIFVFLLALTFAVVSMVFLNYGERLIVNSKINAASAMAGQVAHEIRTPLLAIRLEAEKLTEIAPASLSAAVQLKTDDCNNKEMRANELEKYISSLNRILKHVTSANVVIEMLLTSVGQHHNKMTENHPNSMKKTIIDAMDNYPFKGKQREYIALNIDDDFLYYGSHVLMMHTLYNILKNALKAIANAKYGYITVKLESGSSYNKIIISDTGNGIPGHALPFIFVPFFTTERAGAGSGMGLSFCKEFIETIGGTIDCKSPLHGGAVFTINLPIA